MNSVFRPYSYYIETNGRGKWDKYQHQPSNIHVWSRNEKWEWYKKEKETLEREDENL